MTVDLRDPPVSPNAGRRLPVTLITGFFGSGKTTLLGKILAHPEGANAAVVINEIGELPLDHLIVAAPSPQTVVLAGGCVCCSAQGDLADAFTELLEKRAAGVVPPFTRIIVETTGIADPASVAASIAFEPHIAASLALDGIITMVDGANGLAELESNREAVIQAALADKLLVSKIDLVEATAIDRLRGRLGQINPYASVVQCLHGEMNPSELFNLRPIRPDDVDNFPDPSLGVIRAFARHGDDASLSSARPQPKERKTASATHHLIRSSSLIYDQPIENAGLALWISVLATFKSHKLLRVKALLNIEGRPVVVHAIQHVFHAPTLLEAWPTSDRRSRIVFIWRNIDEEDFGTTLEAFKLRLTSHGLTMGIVQPADYARFSDLARRVRDWT